MVVQFANGLKADVRDLLFGDVEMLSDLLVSPTLHPHQFEHHDSLEFGSSRELNPERCDQ